jgi:cyclic beta-1,2-glucan synthetase
LLLLQERVPKGAGALSSRIATEVSEGRIVVRRSTEPPASGVFDTPHTPSPEVQLLSNGRYHVMVTNAGGGYSRWRDLAVTRWREDRTCDNWGTSATCATWPAASSGQRPTSRR